MAGKFKQALKKRLKEFKEAEKKVARVGVLNQQHYDDNTPVAYVAAIHEYGSTEKHIPPRPFFRPTISDKKTEWGGIAKNLLKSKGEISDALELMGMRAAADVVETIGNIKEPPLQESTVKARKRRYKSKSTQDPEKPLVDTKLLISSISHDVVNKE
ncbi:hypothetical protein ACWA5Z_06735 [Testudinibacter sp. P80/BLE/0925]